MTPSTAQTFCCCSRYFRKNSEEAGGRTRNKSDIEIKVNGRSQLRVPAVSIIPPPRNDVARPESTVINLEEVQMAVTSGGAGEIDEFQTARTSRQADGENLVPMKELMRMVRIEEGLEVTPRETPRLPKITPKVPKNHRTIVSNGIPLPNGMIPSTSAPSIPPMQLNVADLQPKRIRRAVFNEDGDITTRTISSRCHRLSIGSIGHVPVIRVTQPATSSTISRAISSTPQIITAFVAFTYACLTTIFTTIANIFVK